jgi:hypothetical protein
MRDKLPEDEFRPEELLADLIARRARRLGISEDQLRARAERAGPRFLVALRERAQRKGIRLEEALNRDLTELRNSTYPGPDCLRPDEIESLAFGMKPDPEVARHLGSCPACRALVETASSAGQGADVFMDDVRRLLSRVSPAGSGRSGSRHGAART